MGRGELWDRKDKVDLGGETWRDFQEEGVQGMAIFKWILRNRTPWLGLV